MQSDCTLGSRCIKPKSKKALHKAERPPKEGRMVFSRAENLFPPALVKKQSRGYRCENAESGAQTDNFALKNR